jgi:hypothetical protein
MPTLPLFHRLGDPLRQPEASLSHNELILEVAADKAGRTELGLGGCLFASFGVAAYSNPPVVLAFGPAQDFQDDRFSVPWDSRGAGNLMGWSTSVHRQKIEQYSLPAPEDERYLARHLATCFQIWETFLSGNRPIAPDPADVRVLRSVMDAPPDRDLVPLSTPEARFSSSQEVAQGLLAIFVDADYPDTSEEHEDWLKTYTVLRRIVERKNKNGFKSLRRMKKDPSILHAAYAFTRDMLRAQGVLA